MAQTLKSYQLNLNESQVKLREIGQLVKPYQVNFKFDKEGNTISTNFYDEKNNIIDVYFHKQDYKTPTYEVEFNVNKYSDKAFTASTSHFFKIISTVVKIIEQFIEEFHPYQLYIEPDEVLGKNNQKYNIWLQYLTVNLKNKDYILGKIPNGFKLQINSNKND